MISITRDFQFALRMMLKHPGFTLLATLTLALGIGANTTVLSWVEFTLLNPVPGLAQTSGLLSMSRGFPNPTPFSYPDFLDLQSRTTSFSGITAFTIAGVDVGNRNKPERLWATLSSANYFDILGVRPTRGRSFLADEETAIRDTPVVLISYNLWRTHFAQNPSVIGQTININQRPYTIVGVAPPQFQGCLTGLQTDLWIPAIMQKYILPGGDVLKMRNKYWFMLMARLKSGVQREQAEREANLEMQRIVEQFPDSHRGDDRVVLHPLWRAPFGANGYFYILLPMLMAIAGIVLLLACANVANLLLVRTTTRRSEFALRLSLGAKRSSLVRQLMIESLLLALVGGGSAVLVSLWSSRTLRNFVPPMGLPISLEAHVDGTLLAAALFISLLSGLLFGILPALRSSVAPPAEVLKEDVGHHSGARRKMRLSKALVVVQLAISLLLMICAALFVRTFQQMQSTDPGFNPQGVLLASVDLFAADYSEDQGLEFDRTALAKVQTLPGVQSATLANGEPMRLVLSGVIVQPEGYVPQLRESMEVGSMIAGPDYFRTMEIPLASGREFAFSDIPHSQPVVIVNQSFAERFWPHEYALGKRLMVSGNWMYVIGVARNSKYLNLNEAPQPYIYLPAFQNYSPLAVFHVRTSHDPLAAAPDLESALHELNPELPIFDVATLRSRLEVASASQRLAGAIAGAFGLLALTLAIVGIYGVVAFTTRERQYEIGVRMALGAQKREVLWLVLGQGIQLSGLGLVIGLALSFAFTRFLKSYLFSVNTTDPFTFLGVASLQVIVSLAACYIPAYRAARIAPMTSLRHL
jgi:predicted permease